MSDYEPWLNNVPVESAIDEEKRELMQLKVALQTIQIEQLEEKILHENHPALKDAWDKYQAIKQLVKK